MKKKVIKKIFMLLKKFVLLTIFTSTVALAQLAEIRKIDGIGNNIRNPQWGSGNIPLMRATSSAYKDGFQEPSGWES